MTPEELDKATADEAWRLLEEGQDVAVIAARLAREGYRPPPPVDPDVLVVREISAKQFEGAEAVVSADIRLGKYDGDAVLICALDAYKAGREAEAERAKVLVEYVSAHTQGLNAILGCHDTLAAYKAGKAAQ
jgi:hypothetical protein